jgi:hypothetical protein
VDWLKHQIATAGGRKTVLLSHHQLFTAFESEKIGGKVVNEKLLVQTQDILPQVTAWFWGHEHNFVIFEKFQNVLGWCVGHGAFPVGKDELGVLNSGVPVKNINLDVDKNGGLMQYGYIIIQLNGADAAVNYYQYDAESGIEKQMFEENF